MAPLPSERYRKLWKVIRVCSGCCGADVTGPDFHMNAMTMLIYILLVMYFTLVFYTVYEKGIKPRDWIEALNNLCTIGMGIQSTTKLVCLSIHSKLVNRMFQGLQDIYLEYETKHGEYMETLHRAANSYERKTQIIAVMYASQYAIIISVPYYFYFAYGEQIILLQYIFPGFDHTTQSGFFILLGVQTFQALLVVFGNYAVDMIFFNIISHFRLLTDILICKFHDFNATLTEKRAETPESLAAMVDILQWHQKYLDFIKNVKNAYSWILFVMLVTMTMNMILTLFVQFFGNWPGGQCFLVMCFCIMCLYCGLGTQIEVSNDIIIEACYTEIQWYMMSKREQKMLSIMLQMSQQTQGVLVGGVMPLSLTTAVQITKTIYTITMMLMQFMEEV